MPISYKHKIYIPTPDIQNANMRTEHPVKSQISVNYNGANIAFDVLDYDKHDLVDTDTVKTMCVCSHDVISYGTMPFCAPQLMYWSENGLPAGTYKLTLDHAQHGGGTLYDGTYMFTLTKAIPADGGFQHTKPVGGWQSSYAKTDILGNYITTYGARPQRSAIESGVAFSEYDGTTECTDLGTFTAKSRTYYAEDDTVNGGKRNFTERQAYGSNRWRDSVYRQWLNSTAPAGTTGNGVSNWWTPQSVFDRAPGGANSAGFLYGLDPSFVAAMGKVKVITELCDCDKVDGATQDITYDKVWLQSMTEVFGNTNNSISEGVRLAYWNGSTDADRIKYHNGTARYWWLRSPYPTYADNVCIVSSSGALGGYEANGAHGVVPACCIKQYDEGIKPVVSYKRKIYMGRNIEWNQLVDKSKFQDISSLSGISVTNNNDGSVMFDGTKTTSNDVFFSCGTYQITGNHRYYLYGAPGEGFSTYQLYSVFIPTGGSNVYFFDNGNGVFFSGRATASGHGDIKICISQNTVSNLIFKPQLFDLTQMFGAGNEPTTAAEFWQYFDHKLYPYNPGETQPLFKISRKSQWGALPKHYTARWDKVNAAMVRLNDAKDIPTNITNFAHRGSVNANYSNPFDSIYPWAGIKLCNISIDIYRNLDAGDSITKCVTAWEGDANFSYNDVNGVWRYRPEFWGKSWEDDTYRYFDVADKNVYDSSYVHYPEAIVGRWNGRSVSMTVGGTEKTCLIPSVGMPARSISMSGLHTRAKNFGATLDSIYSVDADTLLCVVEFATMNTQNAIGNGVSNLYRQSSDLIQEDATNSATVKVLAAAGSAYCIPGAIFDIGTSNGGTQVGSFVVVSATPNVGDAQYLDVTLDQAVTVTGANYWSVHRLVNIADEGIGSKSGYIGTNGKCNAYYRGIVMYGNMWFYILGAYENKDDHHIWIANSDAEADNYDALDTTVHYDTGLVLPTAGGYTKKLGLLSRSGLLSIPAFCVETGGDNSNPVGDYFYNGVSTWNTVFLRGGHAGDGSRGGAFSGYWGNAASGDDWSLSARPRLKNP